MLLFAYKDISLGVKTRKTMFLLKVERHRDVKENYNSTISNHSYEIVKKLDVFKIFILTN